MKIYIYKTFFALESYKLLYTHDNEGKKLNINKLVYFSVLKKDTGTLCRVTPKRGVVALFSCPPRKK